MNKTEYQPAVKFSTNRGHVATPLGYSKKIGVRPTTNQAGFS